MGTVVQTKSSRPCLIDKSNSVRTRRAGFGWNSRNWSGYAVTGAKGSIKRISAEWNVPVVNPSERPTYSSAWIGIDGFKNGSLIQTGTGHESANGSVNYYAWWEILPASETVIPLPVSPGDRMYALIYKLRPGKWVIFLRNFSKGWFFRTVQKYTGPHNSAEWVVEAPLVGGNVAALTRMSTVIFSRCRLNGKSPRLTARNGGYMIQKRVTVAIPSCPNRSGDSFAVRRSYRKSVPLACSRSPLFNPS
ncbi:G1 family glutamic endopeptidase [Paenibacillus tengchongensis]|uniref:G1 family glutamic endopeptidase n=1 Tax=Paenibacillus tengchongensis TaxID=2608684 RepID=UPI001FE610AD|nr:G1 family glutamic endopeptidase [Paenibacillus tengchongensis]